MKLDHSARLRTLSDQMVQTFSANRANHTLSVRILPWRPPGDTDLLDPQRRELSARLLSRDGVPVVNPRRLYYRETLLIPSIASAPQTGAALKGGHVEVLAQADKVHQGSQRLGHEHRLPVNLHTVDQLQKPLSKEKSPNSRWVVCKVFRPGVILATIRTASGIHS